MAIARICVFVTAMFTICAAAPICTTSSVCIAAQAKEADGKSAEVHLRVEQSGRGTDVIPLHVREPEPGTYRPEVDVLIDGQTKRFVLDSGARKTSVFSDEDTSHYPVIGEDQSGGASGKVAAVDIIQPKKLQLGAHLFLNPHLQRTRANRKINVLGMDLLGQNPFQVDLKNAKLKIIPGISSEALNEPIHKLTDGHIAVLISLGKKECFAVFDTGAERTTVDLQFVKSNPRLFKFVRAEQGIDSLGHNLDSPIYQVDSLKVGALELNKVDIVAFDYGDDFRQKMEGTPIILGSNVIYQAKWSFDVKQSVWAVEPQR